MIRIENLSHIYGAGTPFKMDAVTDISLEIGAGEFVGLIGHTGSGKSTLILHLNGLMKPSSGRVFIDGCDIWAEPKKIRRVRFNVGIVFQYPEHQLFDETVYRDIAFGPRNMALSEDETDERVREAAEAVGISPELLEKSPFDLSGGEKRRVAIAGVLAMRPKVLVLDEPTAGLDPTGRDLILGRIREYHRRTGATVILVSHSMEDIAKTAERVVVLRSGRLAMDGPPSEIFTKGDSLREMGLSVPKVTEIFSLLRREGYKVPECVFTVEQAISALSDILGKGGAERA